MRLGFHLLAVGQKPPISIFNIAVVVVVVVVVFFVFHFFQNGCEATCSELVDVLVFADFKFEYGKVTLFWTQNYIQDHNGSRPSRLFFGILLASLA